MTTPTRSKPTPATETLLTAEELATCKRLAGGTDAAARRAQALLTLHAGGTQLQAAKQSGLTAGQVKYWASRFRVQRLAIFPEAPKPSSKTRSTTPAAQASADTSARAEQPPKAKSKKGSAKKAKKKTGKGKEQKMGKKDKKDKKDKKGKKDKKEKKKKAGKGK